jgi:hypothetical protein
MHEKTVILQIQPSHHKGKGWWGEEDDSHENFWGYYLICPDAQNDSYG